MWSQTRDIVDQMVTGVVMHQNVSVSKHTKYSSLAYLLTYFNFHTHHLEMLSHPKMNFTQSIFIKTEFCVLVKVSTMPMPFTHKTRIISYLSIRILSSYMTSKNIIFICWHDMLRTIVCWFMFVVFFFIHVHCSLFGQLEYSGILC